MTPVSAPARPWVGRAVPRAEDERFVKGEAKYAGDLKPPDLLHAAFVRSMYAHGRIVSVDTEAARARPGVRAVLTAADVEGLVDPFPLVTREGASIVPVMHPVLASGRVRYVGQPLALVVAETPDLAVDAAEHVLVDVEELPAPPSSSGRPTSWASASPSPA
jgi:aerobic carbon-monoxide dehydrogenase large subunit